MFEDVHNKDCVDCIEAGGDWECDHVHCHKGIESKGWNPETDVCNACRECDYFLHEYWNCQGELEPCWEFIPKNSLMRKNTYREMPPDAMQPHDTWIIAFCPDTDSFFVTNQRAFYWESEEEFESEEAGIYFFEHQIQYFIDVEEKLMSDMFINDWNTDCVFLENTNRRYPKN